VTLVVDDGRLRASDADREKTVALLREHHAVGRLTAEEFNDRLEQVYQARTLGELDTLLADLPAIDLYQLPSASIRPGPSPRRSVRRREGPGAHLDRSADNSVAWTAQVARWTGLGVVSMLVWLGLAVAAGGLAWIPWFLLIVIPVAVALGRHRPRPLSRPAVTAAVALVTDRSGILDVEACQCCAVALRRSLSLRNTTRGVGVMPSVRVRGMAAVDCAAVHRLAFRQALCSLSSVAGLGEARHV